ncbi:MAG: SDR family oxidoreductase [Clostridia bacterium]|nr:SDR family oxidoreductase [Clostridia bacterium]
MSVPFKPDLGGRVAVITGGGGVLCSVFAESLAECGAAVAVLDLSLPAAETVAEKIRAHGGTARAYACNVLKKEELLSVRDRVCDELGGPDILINGAGGNSPKATTDCEQYDPECAKSFFELAPEGFGFVFDLNILGTFLPTQVFAEGMAAAGHGCIINISSMNAFRPLTKIPAYSAAKAGVSNLTMWLATHFANTGVRVNALAPGFFVTKQNKDLLFDKDGVPTPRTHKILAATPMGRFGRPEELVGALLFLCDDNASSFVNGVILPVDGGFSAYSGV